MNQLDELTSGVLYPFATWPHTAMPMSAAGVYSIWDSTGILIYVGMSGRGMSNEHLTASQSKDANEVYTPDCTAMHQVHVLVISSVFISLIVLCFPHSPKIK